VTDATETEEQASGCGTYATFVVVMLLTIGGIKQLPWPMWLKVVLAIAANLLVGAVVYGTARKSDKAQVPPGRPGPLSVGAGVGPSRPEPEPTRPEPEPPPQPTKPPEPEPPKPEAISEETLGKVEQMGYRLGRGIAIVLLVAVVTVPVAVVWWLVASS
jgi:hypothetical protein